MNIKFFKGLTALTLALILGGCGDFGDININPNSPSQKDTKYLFTRAMQGVTNPVFSSDYGPGTNLYNPISQLYPQYFAEANNIQYSEMTIWNHTTGTLYRLHLRNLNEIVKMNTNEETKGSGFVVGMGSNNNQIGVAQTLIGLYIMNLSDILGGVYYSEMLMGEENLHPKFDTQKEVYDALDKMLVDAYNIMGPGDFNSNQDILYGGDIDKWKKLNATIRECMAIKLSDVDPATGKARFAKAFADGALDTNADNLVYNYLPENDNANPVYVNYVLDGRIDFFPSNTLVNAFLERRDPRVLTYARPNWKNPENPLFGAVWGATRETKPSVGIVSLLADQLWKQDADITIYSAAKVKLMEAEAALRGWISADPNALYEDGIRLSFEEKGVDNAIANQMANAEGWALIQEINDLITDVDTYLAQPSVMLTGSTQEKIEKVAMQRWMNGFLQNGIEAWSDWRRLNIPKLESGFFATNAGVTHIPYRLIYDTADYQDNGEAYDAIKAAQGDDTINTRVWWDVADNN